MQRQTGLFDETSGWTENQEQPETADEHRDDRKQVDHNRQSPRIWTCGHRGTAQLRDCGRTVHQAAKHGRVVKPPRAVQPQKDIVLTMAEAVGVST